MCERERKSDGIRLLTIGVRGGEGDGEGKGGEDGEQEEGEEGGHGVFAGGGTVCCAC